MLVSLDISIVNVAFGSIAQDFGPESRRTLTWVFSAYNIAYAAGLLTAGRLADAFGRNLRRRNDAHPEGWRRSRATGR